VAFSSESDSLVKRLFDRLDYLAEVETVGRSKRVVRQKSIVDKVVGTKTSGIGTSVFASDLMEQLCLDGVRRGKQEELAAATVDAPSLPYVDAPSELLISD
jgi:hypothetical protein